MTCSAVQRYVLTHAHWLFGALTLILGCTESQKIKKPSRSPTFLEQASNEGAVSTFYETKKDTCAFPMRKTIAINFNLDDDGLMDSIVISGLLNYGGCDTIFSEARVYGSRDKVNMLLTRDSSDYWISTSNKPRIRPHNVTPILDLGGIAVFRILGGVCILVQPFGRGFGEEYATSTFISNQRKHSFSFRTYEATLTLDNGAYYFSGQPSLSECGCEGSSDSLVVCSYEPILFYKLTETSINLDTMKSKLENEKHYVWAGYDSTSVHKCIICYVPNKNYRFYKLCRQIKI